MYIDRLYQHWSRRMLLAGNTNERNVVLPHCSSPTSSTLTTSPSSMVTEDHIPLESMVEGFGRSSSCLYVSALHMLQSKRFQG